MTNPTLVRTNIIACGMLCVLALAGCATTTPKADFSNGMAFDSRVGANDDVKARVDADSGVSILDVERTWLEQRIEERVSAKKVMNAGGGEKKAYEVDVTLTQFDKGNAFARAMLAGLGQIHIDGVVRLYEMPEKKKVSEFAIKKTFSWGGMYGASTSMEDIETTFADGIAATLTGQAEDAPKAKGP